MPAVFKLPALLCVLCGAALLLSGCDTKAPAGKERVVIKGKAFFLDPALDDASRIKGLGGRATIPPDGGMIFVFPFAAPLEFVMRDCPVAIDIAFLDDSGRVLTIHEMKPEEPRREGETPEAYESRLRRYPSRFPSRVAVEVAGGTLLPLGLKPGDVIEFDREGLKARVK